MSATFLHTARSSDGATHRPAGTIEAEPNDDLYQPNDDILTSTPLAIGKSVEASIMDGADTDFYAIQTSAAHPTVRVFVQNLSTTLRPAITAYHPNKQQINYVVGDTPGQDKEFTFAKEPNATYLRADPESRRERRRVPHHGGGTRVAGPESAPSRRLGRLQGSGSDRGGRQVAGVHGTTHRRPVSRAGSRRLRIVSPSAELPPG